MIHSTIMKPSCILLLAVAAAAGCAAEEPAPAIIPPGAVAYSVPGQTKAIAVVLGAFRDAGAAVAGELPAIIWRRGDEQQCGGGAWWNGSTCTDGRYDATNRVIWLHIGAPSFADSGLAHELCHAMVAAPPDFDPTHEGPCFTTEGFVSKAESALRAAMPGS